MDQGIVYSNQEEAERKAFNTATSRLMPTSGREGTFNAPNARSKDIEADEFPEAGTQTYTGVQKFDGKFKGASGTYECAENCTANNNGEGIDLSDDTWTFTPTTGSMVSVADTDYLFFGWWLNKDADDAPTGASAFHGTTYGSAPNTIDPVTIGGTAKYSGKAAGKFAIYNPADKSGDAGHFTANVELTAKFAANAAPDNGGVSGTIDGFRANDESVPWSVKLNRAWWNGATGTFGGADQNTTAAGDQFPNTVWSIDGNAAAAAGSWSGQMYDEADADTGENDGSNVPTSATGVFESHFGSTHSMVGGFGVVHQPPQ